MSVLHDACGQLGECRPTLRGKFFKKSSGLFGKGANWELNTFLLQGVDGVRALYYDPHIDHVRMHAL